MPTINLNTYLHYAKIKGLSQMDCGTLLYVLNSDKHTKDQKKQARLALQHSAKYHLRHWLIVHTDKKFTDRVFSKASNKRLFYWAQNQNSPV